jgi:hypothetical protein
MGLFNKLRRSSRRSNSAGIATEPESPPRVGRDCTKRLPRPVLARIFALVCPHTVDNSYGTSEESASDGCMLCDMRDLAHCALVNKRWFLDARELLYETPRWPQRRQRPALTQSLQIHERPHRPRTLL